MLIHRDAGNILALNTVSNWMGKKGKPLFWKFVGYYICKFSVPSFVWCQYILPDVLGVIEIHSAAAYILWLAIHIAISKPAMDCTEKSASFLKGFLLQFVNVKIYLFGITALTGYITDYSTSFVTLLSFELMIATIGTIATLIWIGLGVLLRKAYQKYYRPINIVLALTLHECMCLQYAEMIYSTTKIL